MGLNIRLLNGKEHDKDELLDMMEDDKFYYGDLSKLALSSSAIKQIYSSPKTYAYSLKYGSPESQALRDGWLFHTAILEPHVFSSQTFVDVKSKNTKAYREALANHDGRVFTMKEKNDAERLADAFYKNEQALQLITKCEFEVPAIGLIEGYPFRGKADILSTDRIVDLKTCTDIKSFPYQAKRYGYDIQVYCYCELFNKNYEQFKFIAMDKGSLDIGIWSVSEEFYLSGKAKVRSALDTYEAFFVNGADLNGYTLTGVL